MITSAFMRLTFRAVMIGLAVVSAYGQEWVQVKAKLGVGPSAAVPSGGVSDVAVDRSGSIYITDHDHNFLYSLDQGQTYNKGGTGLRRVTAAGKSGKYIWGVDTDGNVSRLESGTTWTRSSATGMEDIAVAENGEVACTEAGSGAVWLSTDGETFEKDPGTSAFIRVSYDPKGILWATGSNGSLWKRNRGKWEKAAAENMRDVAAGPQGGVWLTDRGGNVWYSNWGEAPVKVPGAGFENIAVSSSGVAWATGKTGTLWSMSAQSGASDTKAPPHFPNPPSGPIKIPPLPPQPAQIVVLGPINEKWMAIGAGSGKLGPAVANEQPTFDNVGRSQQFRSGLISWHRETGAHVVWGTIGAHWLRLGREKFGYPLTDERPTANGRGMYTHFRALHLPNRPDASIFYSKTSGTHAVVGGIRERWIALGWEGGKLGFPISDEEDAKVDGLKGKQVRFEKGSIVWTPKGGAKEKLPIIMANPVGVPMNE